MRSHLFAALNEQQKAYEPARIDRFSQWIRQVAQSVSLDSVQRVRIRENVFQKISPLPRAFFQWRKAVSLSVMMVFVLGSFLLSGLNPAVTVAQRSTTLEVLHGDVTLLRKGQEASVSGPVILLEGDIISTKPSSEAIIYYFDGSFSRLFENTQVQMRTLYNEDDGLSMIVQVDLTAGQMWSRVFDLVSKSEFTVRAKEMVTSVYKRATFVVSAEQEKASVKVINNAVSVKTKEAQTPQTIVKGYEAVITQPAETEKMIAQAPSQPQVQPLHLEKDEQQWVDNNLEQDQHVIAQAAQQQEQTKAESMNPALLLSSLDEVEQAQVNLSQLEDSFAQTNNPKVFADLLKYVQDLQKKSDAEKDSAKARQLRVLVDGTLSRYKRSFADVSSPQDKKYLLRESVYRLEQEIHPEDELKALAIIDQISAYLLEAQELFDSRQSDLASGALKRYQEKVAELQPLVVSGNLNASIVDKINQSNQFYSLLSERLQSVAVANPTQTSSDASAPAASDSVQASDATSAPATEPEPAPADSGTTPVATDSAPTSKDVDASQAVPLPRVTLPKLDLIRR